jgi:hypothetical protein
VPYPHYNWKKGDTKKKTQPPPQTPPKTIETGESSKKRKLHETPDTPMRASSRKRKQPQRFS